MNNYIDVSEFRGYYDEETEARIYNILNRKFCLKHQMVNASLQWIKNGYCVDVITEKATKDSTKWGFNGEYRFCKRCKKIDCIHYMDDKRNLRRWINSKDYDVANIQHCKRCNKWIYVSGCRVINSYVYQMDKGGHYVKTMVDQFSELEKLAAL